MTKSTWTRGMVIALVAGLTAPALAQDAQTQPAAKDDKAPVDKAKAEKKAIKPKPPADPATPAEPAPAVSGDAAAEVIAGTGIKARQPVGAGDSFTAGTKVWVWSKITGARGTTAKHVWKRDGAVIWEKEFEVKGGRYRTWTRRTLRKPGSYSVEVQGDGGAVLGAATFTVQ